MQPTYRYDELYKHYIERGYPPQQADHWAHFVMARNPPPQPKTGLSSGWNTFHLIMTIIMVIIGLVGAPFTCGLSLLFCFYPVAWAFHKSIASPRPQ